MSKKGKWVMGVLAAVLVTAGFVFPAVAGAATAPPENWAPLIAKIVMGLSLSLGLAGSAVGLSIAFQALLGGGTESFYKNIAVAMMPSSQGIYAIVVLFSNMDGLNTDPYTVAGKAAIAGIAMFFSAWYQGAVCAAGIRSIQEGRNTMANALVAGAMPETYAVFALVMTFIMK
ncbi:MAG: V-type H+-transporting ATPase subunit K [Syntrophaceae bacterium]|nr:MAG: V-type H+-transporting ATPase subunit K [Syntrophaceae bacterium]